MKARLINAESVSIAALLVLCIALMLNLYSTSVTSAVYNDNTTILSKLNVSNVAPHITNMVVYRQGTPSGNNMVLLEGTTINVRCNGTVNDTNGLADINNVNATIYRYSVTDSNDNNSHILNSSCVEVAQLDTLAATYSCNFVVWYYADNGTWTCNMSAGDTGDLKNSSTATNTMDPLFALNLSSTQISFGELDPNAISASDEVLNITNTGNRNLTIGVRAYGETVGDDWAMNCTVGNISLSYERYDIDSGQAWAGMTAVTNTMADIAGLTVKQRVHDGDTNKLNSTNSTYWKIRAPLGTRGICNGTIEIGAKEGN